MLERLGLTAKVQWPDPQRGSAIRHSIRDAAPWSRWEIAPPGVLGELHPRVRQADDLPEQPVLAPRVDLEALLEAADLADAEKELDGFPRSCADEDLALVVDEALPAAR